LAGDIAGERKRRSSGDVSAAVKCESQLGNVWCIELYWVLEVRFRGPAARGASRETSSAVAARRRSMETLLR
jgi:hypothetical protein